MAHTYEVATSLHNFAGDFFQNVFAYELSEAGTHTPFEYADNLINVWVGANLTTYLDLFGSDVIFDFITAKRIDGGGGPSSSLISGVVATGPNPSVSAGIAADIAWQTAAGTNRPGHSYIGAVYDGALSGGQWTVPIFTGKATAFINKMLTALTLSGGAGNADFGIYSRKLHQFNKATAGILKPKPTMLNKRTLPVL